MSNYFSDVANGYTDEKNHFACVLDEKLLPSILLGTEKEILDCIKECVELGINLKNSLALVAYLYERDELSKQVIEALLAAGVDPDNHYYNRIAVHMLYDLGFLDEFIDLLCKYNANLNIIDDNGSTLIKAAASRSDIKTLKMLINKGASVLIQDNYGATALSSLNQQIADEIEYDENYIITDTQKEIIELLDKTARKEMDTLGLLTEEQSAIQNWRCEYFGEDLPFISKN